MKTTTAVLLVSFLAVLLGLAQKDRPSRTIPLQIRPGSESARVTGRLEGLERVFYTVNARRGQFLSLALHTDNKDAHFRLYIPGRGPGDEALFESDEGGPVYRGQLFEDGVHTIMVYLPRKVGSKAGQAARFELQVGLSKAVGKPRPPSEGQAWHRVRYTQRDHGVLLRRQSRLPKGLAKSPVTIAQLTLEPEFSGSVTEVEATYDDPARPTEVMVAVTETGMRDDDLRGVRHLVNFSRNSNKQWRVTRYRRGELRRVHFR